MPETETVNQEDQPVEETEVVEVEASVESTEEEGEESTPKLPQSLHSAVSHTLKLTKTKLSKISNAKI